MKNRTLSRPRGFRVLFSDTCLRGPSCSLNLKGVDKQMATRGADNDNGNNFVNETLKIAVSLQMKGQVSGVIMKTADKRTGQANGFPKPGEARNIKMNCLLNRIVIIFNRHRDECGVFLFSGHRILS